MKHFFSKGILSFHLAFILPLGSLAATEFAPPAWAQESNAVTSVWQNFSTGFGDPGNLPDQEGSDAGGLLIQSTPGAFVTGSGNIYNPAAPSTFVLTASSDQAFDQVLVQAKITGGINPDSVGFNFVSAAGHETMSAETIELGRETGPQGDTVLYQWSWDTRSVDVNEFTVRFSATGPHSSLVSVRLDSLIRSEGSGERLETVFSEPNNDRWNYSFNATPGTRPRASVFQSVDSEVGVVRHGVYVITYNTSELIPAGKTNISYEILSAQLRIMTSDNFEAAYDPTLDPVVSFLPETTEGFVKDEDPGRPVELFGAALRHSISLDDWIETAPYTPEGEIDRSIFPAVLDPTGNLIDVTLAVDYAAPVELAPFALGTLSDTESGDLIPADSWMEFDIDLSQALTVDYIQRSLSHGILALSVTSLSGGGQGNRTFPEFYTKDSLLGEAPQLRLNVRLVDSSSEIKAPTMTEIETIDSKIQIRFKADDIDKMRIRWTQDFINWTDISSPSIQPSDDGSFIWTDTDVDRGSKFYQVLQQP